MTSATASGRRPRDELAVVNDLERAAVLLHPLRRRLLEELAQPDSAAGLARRLGVSRQQLNYHLRELENAGLVELVEERRRGNCIERVVRPAARRFVISPAVLGNLGGDLEGRPNHFSWSSLVAAAARAIRELGRLRQRAEENGERLATLTLEAEVRFASSAERDAFARELTEAVARLVARHHDATAAGEERFRLLLAAYPSPQPEDDGDSG